MVDRNTLKAVGWALGKIFSRETAQPLVDLIDAAHKPDGHVFIAVTHDCSVISSSLTNEPFLEYLSVFPIDTGNGQFTNARNIRRLHLQIEVDGELVWYEAAMRLRGFVNRIPLATCTPDPRYVLPDDSKAILKRWLANRYVSQTFPDKFNQLTGALVKDSKAPLIKAFNTEVGKACNSIFISLTPSDRDIEAQENYEVVIALLFRDELAMEVGRDALDAFADEIAVILETIQGLDPVSVHALAESDATYSQIVKMSRWQLDYVSIKDDAEILSVDHS